MTALHFPRMSLVLAAGATLLAAGLIQPADAAAPDAKATTPQRSSATVSYHKVDIDGVKVFYGSVAAIATVRDFSDLVTYYAGMNSCLRPEAKARKQ